MRSYRRRRALRRPCRARLEIGGVCENVAKGKRIPKSELESFAPGGMVVRPEGSRRAMLYSIKEVGVVREACAEMRPRAVKSQEENVFGVGGVQERAVPGTG